MKQRTQILILAIVLVLIYATILYVNFPRARASEPELQEGITFDVRDIGGVYSLVPLAAEFFYDGKVLKVYDLDGNTHIYWLAEKYNVATADYLGVEDILRKWKN